MKETVSCIIPVYNGERFIDAAIQSVLGQTVTVSEIIVVDDGSNDGTKGKVAEFGGAVSYVRQENQGSVAARNHGLRLASGHYVAFLDADDLWQPEKIALQVERFRQEPRLGACCTYMQNFWMEEVAGEISGCEGDRLTAPQPGVASTLMAKARVFDEVGSLDATLHHRDIQDWMIRVRSAGWQIDTLQQVLVRRRVHGGNVSRNRIDTGDQELLRLARETIARKRRSLAT